MLTTILADDETLIIQSLKKILEQSELEIKVVGEAHDGMAALELIKFLKPDIAVLDIRMPFLSGLEVLRELKIHNLPTKVIFLSAHREFEYAQEGIRFGAVGYLVKPLDDEKLVEIIQEVQRQIEREPSGQPEAAGTRHLGELSDDMKAESRVITRVKQYCEQNYHNEISLEQIANYINMSKSYFSAFFKKKTNVHFSDYLTAVRIDKAKEMLAETEIKINAIAERVGYKNSSHFGRVFKEVVGITPAEYRERHLPG